MFSYYLSLALRSLRHNVVLTSLMVLAIGVGIGASMTMLTIFRAASGNPIPEKSAQLFVPQIDNFGPRPGAPPQARDQLPPDLTYADAQALMQAHRATHQAAMYPTTVSITPPDARQVPLQGNARATYRDFFSMFDVPFQFGAPWGQKEDDRHAAVVVLTRAFNQQLFGGIDSVGRSLLINNRPYRVIGVLDDWQPRPRFYDLGQENFSGADQLFLPFSRAIDAQMMTSGNFNCDRPGAGSGWDGVLRSNCIWIKFWLELPDVQAVARYRSFLGNYAAEQRKLGRFHWAPRVALRNVPEWLAYNHVMPAAVTTLTSVSFAVLAVCLLNATGLMLAKYMSRSASVGVRRALGADRPAIFAQGLVEAAMLGLVGGLIGLGMIQLGLIGSRVELPHDLAGLTHMRASDFFIALALAIMTSLLAGLYPAWRAMQVEPALQIKAE